MDVSLCTFNSLLSMLGWLSGAMVLGKLQASHLLHIWSPLLLFLGRGLLFFREFLQIYIVGLLLFLKFISGTPVLKILVRTLNCHYRGVLLILIIEGQGPIALAVGAGGGCLDIFILVYHFSFLSPSLWGTARYRLKYCLKGPLSPKQPTN